MTGEAGQGMHGGRALGAVDVPQRSDDEVRDDLLVLVELRGQVGSNQIYLVA
jgi:hypothetical protein